MSSDIQQQLDNVNQQIISAQKSQLTQRLNELLREKIRLERMIIQSGGSV